MALVDNAWYVNFGNGSSTGFWAVTAWATGATIAAGALRRATSPAVGAERVFVAIVGGTTHATTQPTWVTTRGGKTTDNTVTWQECTGVAALNGDATNTPSWSISATPPGGVKNTAVSLGQVIKRDNGASYQICTTAGTAGNGAEPAFSDTAGTTTADNTVTWTSLGAVGNFTGWQAPHARLSAAFTANWGQAGNSFYVASEHAETIAATATYTSPGSITAPCYIYCVTKTTVPPTSANLTTGAELKETGTNNMTLSGVVALMQGVNLNSSGRGPAITGIWNLKNAAILIGTGLSSGSVQIGAGTNSVRVEFDNVTVSFANVGQGVSLGGGRLIWRNTLSAILGAAVPNSLFRGISVSGGMALIEGVDLSALGSTKNLVDTSIATEAINVVIKDCKLGASVALSATPLNPAFIDADLINCDSGATNYRHERLRYAGSQVVETTIVRTGGATNGTTPISWKIVTTVNSRWTMPFESMPMAIWNDTSGSAKTITVEGIWGGGAVPNNDDIWIEVEYPGDASYPQGYYATSTKADNLAAGGAGSSSAAAWGGSTTAFKMAVTITPLMKGPIYVRVHAAKASSTFYIDPVPTVT